MVGNVYRSAACTVLFVILVWL